MTLTCHYDTGAGNKRLPLGYDQTIAPQMSGTSNNLNKSWQMRYFSIYSRSHSTRKPKSVTSLVISQDIVLETKAYSQRLTLRGCVPVGMDDRVADSTGKKYPFMFDKVFNHEASHCFDYYKINYARPNKGLMVCIFAYGQTGSGKTYTMMGRSDASELKGLIPRSLEQIFEISQSLKDQGGSTKCRLIYLFSEYYIILNRCGKQWQGFVIIKSVKYIASTQTENGVPVSRKQPCTIKQDGNGNTYVSDLTIVDVCSAYEISSLLQQAAQSSVGVMQNFMFYTFVPSPKEKCSKNLQLGVSFVAGYVAGVLCAIVQLSHPVDNLVSFLNHAKGATVDDVSIGTKQTHIHTTTFCVMQCLIESFNCCWILQAVKKIGIVGLFTSGLPVCMVMIGTLTGCGKSELAKVLAAYYFGFEEDMIQLYPREFMERHTVSKL
ncbi:Kinesin-like protein KIN-14D, partial [Mucuna pruriens]